MSVKIGNTTIYFGPLIAYLAILIIAVFIYSFSIIIRGRKIKKSFETGAYSKVIKDGEKLLKTYQKLAKRSKHKNTIAWIESLHFVLAVSYFSTMDWDLFLNHINSMSQYVDTKNFWLSLYYIYHDRLNEAQLYYDNIAQTEENAINLSYLDCLICYKQGDVDSAKAKMNDIYPKLKHPILKHISDKLLYKIDFNSPRAESTKPIQRSTKFLMLLGLIVFLLIVAFVMSMLNNSSPLENYIFQTIDECEQLIPADQTGLIIEQYASPEKDKNVKDLSYESFFGMYFRSNELEYEIFAYEFADSDSALKYYIHVTGQDYYEKELPLGEDNENKRLLSSKGLFTSYTLIVVYRNKAYRIVAPSRYADAIDKMLETVFSFQL